jgi:hypothetical protein
VRAFNASPAYTKRNCFWLKILLSSKDQLIRAAPMLSGAPPPIIRAAAHPWTTAARIASESPINRQFWRAPF